MSLAEEIAEKYPHIITQRWDRNYNPICVADCPRCAALFAFNAALERAAQVAEGCSNPWDAPQAIRALKSSR